MAKIAFILLCHKDPEAIIKQAERLTAVSDGSGAHVSADGGLVDATGVAVRGLGLLGRITEGSTIATDSIHDCFGPATRAWASSVAASLEEEAAHLGEDEPPRGD